MAELDNKLLCVSQNSIRRRIKREIEELIKLEICDENNITIEIIPNMVYYNASYKISFYNMNDLKYYEFIISLNYPFKPPKLNINFKPYSYYQNFNSFEFRDALFKHKNIRCFCCKSVLCGNNWSPAMTIKTILTEFTDFRNICREITDRVIINVIKRKYLIEDINILTYLYL